MANLFIISIIKMILFQNDYVVVDSTLYSGIGIQQENEFRELNFSITVQCNGKLKRTRFSVPIERVAEGIDGSEVINGYTVKDYNYIYNPFQMFRDLGYDVPYGTELHPLVRKAINNYFA